MRKKVALLVLFLAVFILYGEAKKEKIELPERFKKWLDEEVVYIITPMEREVFLKLENDRERDLFIEAFWKQRDRLVGLPEGEARREHYRRISYVNQFYGRTSPRPAWKTDRGRVYIILGEPNDIQRFEGSSMVRNSEIWFYQGKTKLGLPPGFNLVFFQEGSVGEYRLYSPLKDGPQALMTSYWGDPMDYSAAYRQLQEFEPDLAEVSLSLIPGERSALGRPSLSSDLLIQKVETVPVRQIRDRYAQKFLEYKDIVEVDYSANYMESDSLVKVMKDPSGLYFVHYAIEPERLSVNMYEDRYFTNLMLNGIVTDMEGKTIFQFDKKISLQFDKETIKRISSQPFSVQDMFPLIPGNYKLSLLVKNEASKEFTSLEKNLFIPHEEDPLQMTSIILGYRIKKSEADQNKLRPFQAGAYQIYFQANRVFLKEDTLILSFQIHGLSEALKKDGEIRYDFVKGGQEFSSTSKKVTEYPELPDILEEFPLREFSPDHYRIRVSLLVNNREVVSNSEEFDITPLGAIARPWVYSKILTGRDDPVYSYIIGTQLFNAGKINEAQASLEEAYHKRPTLLDFAFSLAQVYMRLDEYKKVESVLLPFLNQTELPNYEVFFMMGKAYQNMGELRRAIEVFDKAISHYGLNINLLNAIGECYFQLGEADEALAAWEKSLEINSDQPEIKKYIQALKDKK